MMGLLVFKDKLKKFYNNYEWFLRPVFKFAITFVALMLIQKNVGYMEGVKFPVISVVCAFLPWGLIVIIASAVIIANLYALTIEIAVVILAVMLIMFLMFFRFVPEDSIFLMIVPMAFFLKIPYIIPIAAGLICTPVSAISVVFGTFIYYSLDVISKNQAAISAVSADETSASGVSTIINMIFGNKEMVLAMVAFTVVLLIVYAIKRKSIDNSWITAIIVGTITDFVIILIGSLLLDTKTSIVWLIIGSIISLIIAFILQFFVFSVDYSRTEHTQFEDDEYYYYVKAVPKINVSEPDMNVKRINAQRKHKNKKVSNKK